MSDALQVRGIEDLRLITRDLRALENRGLLRKEFTKSLTEGAAEVMGPLTSAAARDQLPKRGGLNELVANQPIKAKTNTSSAKWAGVDLVSGKKRSGSGGADAGSVRHPVFGNRKAFAVTTVPAGWFSKTVKANQDRLVPVVDKAIQRLMDRVGEGLR